MKQCSSMKNFHMHDSGQRAIGVKLIDLFHLDKTVESILIDHFGLTAVQENLYECTTLWHEHVEYRRSCVYVIGLDDTDDRPSFAQVTRILGVENLWILLIDLLETHSYSEDLCAWRITTNQNLSLIDPAQISYLHKGLDVYHVNQLSYISLTSKLTKWKRNFS